MKPWLKLLVGAVCAAGFVLVGCTGIITVLVPRLIGSESIHELTAPDLDSLPRSADVVLRHHIPPDAFDIRVADDYDLGEFRARFSIPSGDTFFDTRYEPYDSTLPRPYMGWRSKVEWWPNELEDPMRPSDLEILWPRARFVESPPRFIALDRERSLAYFYQGR